MENLCLRGLDPRIVQPTAGRHKATLSRPSFVLQYKLFTCLSMKSRIIYRNIKTLLFKTLIRPVLTYGAETWELSKQDEHRLSIFERKILRRIYGPVIDGGRWRIRTNQELYQLCGENDIVKFFKMSRLRWAGHVIRQDDDDLSRRVLLSEPGGKRPRGRPRLRWEDGVKEDAAKLGCRN